MEKDFCFSAADILLPKENFEKWSVIACDQYTSEPEYWESVKDTVGDSISALNLILPEVYLKDDNTDAINSINKTMDNYLDKGVFDEYKDSIFYVERTQSDGKVRKGIIGKIDLSQYDYTGTVKDAAIRSTEQTVIERIPPRVKIRENAKIELPHVMLLIDDPEFKVIEPLSQKTADCEKLYDFKLFGNAGSIKGYRLGDGDNNTVVNELKKLQSAGDGLLFCVGDGNHSLATAKACYEADKNELSRYALVEIVNIHDVSLQFEPIYRVVFGVDAESLISDFVDFCGGEKEGEGCKKYRCVYGKKERIISVAPKYKLAVGALQKFLDDYISEHTDVKIDYIHGEASLEKLAENDNTVGFIFDGMDKSELFGAVLTDGSLPRKSFSMGHADDKRFYVEARHIK